MSRPRRSRGWWAAKVEMWERSGLSAAKFAARHRLSERSLRWWKWKLGEEEALHEDGAAARDQRQRFVEVEVGGAVTPAGLELTSPTGWTVRLPPGFDDAELARVVAAMEVAS